MRKPLLWLSFCLFFALPLVAQHSIKDIQAELESKYKGQIIRTKVSSADVSLHFDSTGKPSRKLGKCESWTLCNVFQVEKVSLNDHQLKIEGQRIAVGFENGKEKFYSLRGQFIEIEIDIDGLPDLQKTTSALCSVFICKNDNFANYLPYAWARYFDAKTTVPSPNPLISKDAQKAETRHFINAGLMASKLTSQAPPRYPATAKAYRQQGTVGMSAIIGKDGKIHDLFLTSAVGFGLDEAALEAVRQWTYRPTTLNGEPVDVQTNVYVNFSLRR